MLKALHGKTGATGGTGATGTGATGPTGANLTFTTPLASGQTETGVWAMAGGSSTTGLLNTVVTFRPRLPAALGPANTNFAGNTPTANCPQVNPPKAAANELCFYLTGGSGGTFNNIVDPGTNMAGANQDGAEINFTLSGSTAIERGTWAYTAP